MNIFRKLSALFGRWREQHTEEINRMIISARDTEQLLPNKVDNQLLLRFFQNEEDACIPHRHEDIVNFTDNDMERYHDR